MFWFVIAYFKGFFQNPLFLFFIKAKEGYTNLTGIDYSAASVALAMDVLQAEDLNNISVKVSSFNSSYFTVSYSYLLDINNSWATFSPYSK